MRRPSQFDFNKFNNGGVTVLDPQASVWYKPNIEEHIEPIYTYSVRRLTGEFIRSWDQIEGINYVHVIRSAKGHADEQRIMPVHIAKTLVKLPNSFNQCFDNSVCPEGKVCKSGNCVDAPYVQNYTPSLTNIEKHSLQNAITDGEYERNLLLIRQQHEFESLAATIKSNQFIKQAEVKQEEPEKFEGKSVLTHLLNLEPHLLHRIVTELHALNKQKILFGKADSFEKAVGKVSSYLSFVLDIFFKTDLNEKPYREKDFVKPIIK